MPCTAVSRACGAVLIALLAASAGAQPAPATVPASNPPAAAADPAASAVFVQLGHNDPVQDLSISDDGKWLAAVDIGGTLVIWDTASQRELRRMHAEYGVAHHVEFLHDSVRLAWTSGTTDSGLVTLSDIDGNILGTGRDVHKGFMTGVAVDRAGHVYSADETGKLVQWSDGLKSVVRTLDTRGAGVSALRMSADDHLLAGTADGRVFDYAVTADGTAPVRQWQAGKETVSSVAAGPRGLVAVSFGRFAGTAVHKIGVFGPDTHLQRELDVGPGRAASLAFSPDGRILATVTDRDLAVLAAGGYSLAGHETVTLWHTDDWSAAGQYVRPASSDGFPAFCGRIAFAADGQRLFVADWDALPRSLRVDHPEQVEHAYTGYAKGLKHLAMLGTDQVVTADWYGTPYTGPALTQDDYVAEFGGAGHWGKDKIERARPSFSSTYFTPSKLYALSRWDLVSGRLERVEKVQRAAIRSLQPMSDGSVISLSVMFPEFTPAPPLRIDLVDAVQLVADQPAQVQRFGGISLYPDTDPLFPQYLPDPAIGAAPGAVRLAAVSVGGGVYATVAEITLKGAERRELAVYRRDPGAAGPQWKLQARAVLQDPAAGLALSADGAIAWVSSTPVPPGTPGALGGIRPRQLAAYDAGDGHPLDTFDLGKVFPPQQILPLADGRSAAVSGGGSVAIATIGTKGLRELRVPVLESLIRTMAVAGDGADLAAATPNAIYVWSLADGAFRYAVRSEAAATQSLALTDRLLLSAHDDGSVSVRQRSDGALLAHLFRFSSDEWLTMTPEGYFVGSPHGDEAVNVRVGRQVFGVSQFYDVFYRPDLVQRELAGQNIRPLIRLTLADALQRPPPAVGIAARPSASGRSVQIDYRGDSQGGGVGQLRLYHNGKVVDVAGDSAAQARSAPAPVAAAASLDAASLSRTLAEQSQAERAALAQRPSRIQLSKRMRVDLLPGDNTVAVVATNADGSIASRPQVIDLYGRQPAAAGRIHLVSIGIDHFAPDAGVHALNFARKDADDLATALAAALRRSAPGQPVLEYRLRDGQATSAGLARLLHTLKARVRSGDVVIWFVASHGVLDGAAQYAIVLHDWRGGSQGLLGADAIVQASRDIPALRQIYILDTCHAGGLDSTVAGLYDARLSVLARSMGLHVLASASAAETAIDGYQGNGLFTHTLLQGLDGGARHGDGEQWISITELGAYAQAETLRIARILRHLQRPLVLHYGDDIEIERLPAAAPAPPG